MENPLLSESPLPYGAPQFDKIKVEHYLPAFEKGFAEGKEEVDRIVSNPEEPTFENTVVALEQAGGTLSRVSGIFYNLMEADSNAQLEEIAEKVAPKMTEYSLYISLNEKLFEKVKKVYDKRADLNLDREQERLLEKTYKSFSRNGANLSEEDKKLYGKYSEELSLATLEFDKNMLAAANAFSLNLTDEADLEGLPQFVRDMGAQTAVEKGQKGWTYDLSRPSYAPFMMYSARRDLRKQMYLEYNKKGVGPQNSNLDVVKKIVELRSEIARLLGYETYADYALEERMACNIGNVRSLLDELMEPSLPAAKKEIAEVLAFARENGYEDQELQAWDFSYWNEKYKNARYSVSDEVLKPYFQLENCIDAVFGLAGTLYGLRFEERSDIPGYHNDVKVYDVKDADGKHLALFYADFFPRASKKAGAWMTEFRGQSIIDGVENRPFISIVTNFSKPTSTDPSLLTHDEFNTFLHEFGHALHGMMAQGRYESMTGTNVARDFVELPSQIMENWAFEPEYLQSFAKHYQTGEMLPSDLIGKLVASKNYLAAYYQVRQLCFGILDMAWYTGKTAVEGDIRDFEQTVLRDCSLFPSVPETCISTSFAHIFSGGYSAGYYSYKWAEVLSADAFSLFRENGIFNADVAGSFRKNILEKGSSEDEAVLYRNFRGRDPQTRALLEDLGISPVTSL